MKLDTIYLNNWKSFRDPVEIELSPNINVIYGPNESGKSTLIEALRMIFFYKHTSKSQKIKDIVPWGSKLYPNAQISFQEDGETYRITKRFMNPESILEKYYQDRWNKVAEGDVADRELVKILGGNLPTRGDSKPELWGLGQSLWMVQGQPLISEELNPETISSLKGLIGAAIESEEEKKVLDQIQKEFTTVYTGAKRNPRAGSQLLDVKEKLAKLKDDQTIANAQKIRKEEIIRDIEDKEVFLNKNKKDLEDAVERKLELKDEVNSAQNHRMERQDLENRLSNLNLKYESLKASINDIKDSKSIIKKLIESREELNLKETPLRDEFNRNKEILEDYGNRIRSIEDEIDYNTEEKRIAGIAHTTVMEEQELEEKLSKLKYVEDLSQKIKEKEIEISSLKSPSLEELETIEKLAAQILDTEIRLDAIGLTIESNIKDISGEMFLDGNEKPLKLENDKQSWKAHQSFKLNIDNVGSISVKSGSSDVKKMREDLEILNMNYQENIAPYDIDDPQQLRDIYNKEIILNNRLLELNNDLSKQAENGMDELEKEVTRLKRKIELNWELIPSESRFKDCQNKKELVTVRALLSNKINHIEKEINVLKEKRNKLNSKLQGELSIKEGLQSQIASLNEDIRGNKDRLEQVEEQLSKQESDGLTIEKRENGLNKISQELERKEGALKVYNSEIEDMETLPLTENEAIENKVNKLQDSINNLEINHSNLKKDLEYIMNNSKDSNKLDEEFENLERSHKELEIEAKAYELLYDLNTHYREITLEELSEPVNKIFSHDLEKLLGPKYCFNLGKDIKPETVDVIGANEEANLDCLSFGTQEQIWCLFRLALGRLLSSEERQLVILDDPLVNTDEARMHRVLEILEDSARDIQLIIVTCDMENYSSLNAKFIGLERGALIEK